MHSRDLMEVADGWWLEVFEKGAKVRSLPVFEHIAMAMRQLRPDWVFPGGLDGHL